MTALVGQQVNQNRQHERNDEDQDVSETDG